MDTFAALQHKLALVEREVDGTAARARLARVGKVTEGDVSKAIRADIGDQSMSGWKDKGGTAIELGGHSQVLSDHEVEIDPGTTGGANWRKGKGPMRVLEQGRQQYAAGDRRQSGTYTSKRTGLTTAKTRKVKRNTGATEGKGTWTDATQIMVREMPKRYEAEFVKDLARHLRRG